MKTQIQVNTNAAPAAFGSFSQAIRTDTLVFSSGQLPLHRTSGELVDEEVEVQTHQVLNNLKAILDESECSLDDVAKATVFITSTDDFDTVNKIYATYFTSPFPARSSIEVPKLAKGAKVEIEAIALVKQA